MTELKDLYPVRGMTVIPEGIDFMPEAWLAFVRFSIGNEDCRKSFKDETGKSLDALVAGSLMGKLIDNATSHEGIGMAAFCDWVTVNFWGVQS